MFRLAYPVSAGLTKKRILPPALFGNFATWAVIVAQGGGKGGELSSFAQGA